MGEYSEIGEVIATTTLRTIVEIPQTAISEDLKSTKRQFRSLGRRH